MSTKLSAMLYVKGTIEDMRQRVQTCLDHGITDISIPDHIIGGVHRGKSPNAPWLAMWPTVMDIASKYEKANVGTLVASPLMRPAATLTVDAATVASIVGSDRFTLTVGAGGSQSDQDILGLDISRKELSKHFGEYLREIQALRNGGHLKLASEFALRIASDSLTTIDLVNELGTDWVTTGNYKGDLETRIAQVNKLSKRLKASGFNGKTSFFTLQEDGISHESTPEETEQFASKFDCNIDEIIFPFY